MYNAKDEPTIFGDLRKQGTSFVAWFPFRRRVHWMGNAIEAVAQELPAKIVTYYEIGRSAKWQASSSFSIMI